MSEVTVGELEAAIRNVPDFPKPGIQFKDITPVLREARLFAGAIDLMVEKHANSKLDACVGIDARGFIFAAAAAPKLGTGLVPVRKKGKLPWKTHEKSFALEYGEATVAVHQDALQPGDRVLLLDDLLATRPKKSSIFTDGNCERESGLLEGGFADWIQEKTWTL